MSDRCPWATCFGMLDGNTAYSFTPYIYHLDSNSFVHKKVSDIMQKEGGLSIFIKK